MPRRSRPQMIPGFVEAAHAALDLRDRHPNAHVAAMLDRAGRVLDFHVFEEPHHTADDAMGWAHCMLLNIRGVTRILLLSAVDRDLDTADDADVAFFLKARRYCEEVGVELVDWILANRQRVRAMSCDLDDEPWGVSLPLGLDGVDGEEGAA